MFDIITLGSATVDVFLYTYSNKVKVKNNLLTMPMGSKILVDCLDIHTGGGGTNTAVSFSRLGLKTGYLGRVGRGNNGTRIINELKKEKVKFLGKREGRTAYSVIIDGNFRDRTILTYKGEGGVFGSCDAADLRKSKWLYVASVTESCFPCAVKMARKAKKTGTKIAFNPSSYLAGLGEKFLRNMISITDVIVMNKEEAQLITGHKDVKYCLKHLHDLGPSVVAITNGIKKVHVYDRESLYTANPIKHKAKETTGAGDAFASAFVAGLVKSKGVELALKLAIANAGNVVMSKGAKNGLLSYKKALKSSEKVHITVSNHHVKNEIEKLKSKA